MRQWRHGPGVALGTGVVVFDKGRKTTRFLILILALTVVASCSKRGQPDVEGASNSKVVAATPPFQTKEPARYQALRTVSFAPASGSELTITRKVIAKDGEMRREEETSHAKRVVYLDLANGRFLLLPDEKVYASLNDGVVPDDLQADSDSDRPSEIYLHTGPIQSTYENVGSEDVSGRATRKYRVVVNSSGAESVNDSETLIWVDETLGMPIKTVTRSASGTRTTELSEIRVEVEKGLFQIPANYQKIDARLLRQRLR